MDFSDQYMQDLGDLWSNPSVNEYDVSSSMVPLATEVQFLNINDSTVVYKYQSRVRKEAKQRLKNAEVQIIVTSPYEVKTIKAWVQREEKAADLFAYNVGRVEFSARDVVFKGSQRLETGFGTKNCYEIDLDSIYYDNPYDKRPVYKLAKTDMTNRNKFQVVVQAVFADNSLSDEFVSPAFYCCTQPKINTKRKARSTNGDRPCRERWSEPEFYDDSQVIDYFEARQAVIGNLEVKGTLQSPKMKADIAYHFDVRPKEFQQILTEGDVVGLTANGDGETSIIELSAKNMSTITQAGVISRSAFFEGNIPEEKAVDSDKICIMGIVKVKVAGKVKNGERVYASTRYPGRAVSECHPLCVEDDILLGIAMENCNGESQKDVNLVRCFVSFLCGINAKYCSKKARALQAQADIKIGKAVDQKWKELNETVMSWCLIFTFFMVILCMILCASISFT